MKNLESIAKTAKKEPELNRCQNYKIPCVYALSDNAPVPCFGSQEQCNAWRAKYEKEMSAVK